METQTTIAPAAPERIDATFSGGITQRIEQINPDALTRDQFIRATALNLAAGQLRLGGDDDVLSMARKFAAWIETGDDNA